MNRFLFLIAGFAIVFAACSKDSENSNENKEEEQTRTVMMLPVTKTISLTAEQKSSVEKNNTFAFKLFQETWKKQIESNKSLLLSPLSMSYVMGMLGDGAQGATAEEIYQTMGFDVNSRAVFDELCHKLLIELPQVDSSVKLGIANALMVNKNIELKSSYQQTMKDVYQAEVASLDFSQPQTINYINQWCSNKTSGMIPEILKADDIDEATAMLLMNATYFKATWTKKFDAKNTRNEKFSATSGDKMLPMMHQSAVIRYAANDTCSMISLPYGSGDKWSMTVILPAEGKTLSDIIPYMTQASDAKLQSKLDFYTVDIKIPRFTTASDVDLNQIIADMGAPTMFTEQADFSAMATSPNSLFVSKIKQKTKAEIDEEGTAMTAVTVAAMGDTANAYHAYPSATFHCNRPFLYIVREASSGIILFIGCYYGE